MNSNGSVNTSKVSGGEWKKSRFLVNLAAFLGSGTSCVHQAWYLDLWSVLIHN